MLQEALEVLSFLEVGEVVVDLHLEVGAVVEAQILVEEEVVGEQILLLLVEELPDHPLSGDTHISAVGRGHLVTSHESSAVLPVHGENCQAGLVDGVLLQDQVGHLVRPVILPHLGVADKPVNDDHQMFY